MRYEEFIKHLSGMNYISQLKIRDKDNPFSRGYTIYARPEYYLLVSIDSTTNIYFDRTNESVAGKVATLLYKGVEIGAISLTAMEVYE